MSYRPDIPTDLPPPSVIVDQIRTNFSQYASIFDNNHIAINATNQGKHSNVILQRQVSNPIVDGNFDSLYSKSVTSNSSTSEEVFVTVPRFISDQINIPQQLTFNSVNTAGPVYQSFIYGGYIVYFGTTNNRAIPITLSPVPTDILCIIANPTKFSTTIQPQVPDCSVIKISTSQFQIVSFLAGLADTFTWFAIGSQ